MVLVCLELEGRKAGLLRVFQHAGTRSATTRFGISEDHDFERNHKRSAVSKTTPSFQCPKLSWTCIGGSGIGCLKTSRTSEEKRT